MEDHPDYSYQSSFLQRNLEFTQQLYGALEQHDWQAIPSICDAWEQFNQRWGDPQEDQVEKVTWMIGHVRTRGFMYGVELNLRTDLQELPEHIASAFIMEDHGVQEGQ